MAVCLLWGFRHPEHERRVAELVAEALPDAHVSTSHGTAAVFREYERLATTTVDAAVSPLLRRYLRRLTERTGEAGLPDPEIMLSSGGVADAATAAAHGSWTVLSGPAGGAVAAARAAAAAGAPGAVGLDMGGTSCDVSLVLDGRVAVTGGREVGGRSLALPMIDVHTVGAGGGSIAWRDPGGALRVGPRSAGADPGPGLLRARRHRAHRDRRQPGAGLPGRRTRRWPATCAWTARPPSGRWAPWPASWTCPWRSWRRASRAWPPPRWPRPRAWSRSSAAWTRATWRWSPSAAPGGLHAAGIADELGMSTVIAPVVGGVLSALGLAVSERRRDLVESVLLSGDELTRRGRGRGGRAAWPSAGARSWARPRRRCAPTYELRYAGQAFELPVEAGPEPDPDELREGFDAAHEERYGYRDPDAELELVTVRVAVALPGSELEPATAGEAERRGTRSARFGDEVLDAAVLGPGSAEVEGPAVFELPGSTLVVPPGWSATADGEAVVMRAMSLDPIELQVMLGALRAACDEMGVVLVRSAHSANIKERRDASTALFDARGPDGHAGRAHPRAPGRDAQRRGRGAWTRSRRPATPGS